MIAPGCATRSARWLPASGVVGCGRLQPTSSRRCLFFERNRQSVRPLRAATAETEGVISCESLQLIASSRAQYLTVTNEKSRSGEESPPRSPSPDRALIVTIILVAAAAGYDQEPRLKEAARAHQEIAAKAPNGYQSSFGDPSRIRKQVAQEVYDEYRFNIRGSQGGRSAQH